MTFYVVVWPDTLSYQLPEIVGPKVLNTSTKCHGGPIKVLRKMVSGTKLLVDVGQGQLLLLFSEFHLGVESNNS